MSEDKDYEDILSGSIDEVKDEVDEMDDPDFQALMDAEKDGKDRKTLKQYFEEKMEGTGSSEEETETEEETQQTLDEEPEEGVVDEEVSDTSFTDSMSFWEVLVIGGVIGLIAGAAVGYTLSPSAASGGSPQQAQQAVEDLVTAGGFNGTVDVGQPERRHGMYFFNVTFNQETPNGTQTGNQAAYVTTDGELFFPVVDSFFMQSPINIQERLAQQEAQSQQPAQ